MVYQSGKYGTAKKTEPNPNKYFKGSTGTKAKAQTPEGNTAVTYGSSESGSLGQAETIVVQSKANKEAEVKQRKEAEKLANEMYANLTKQQEANKSKFSEQALYQQTHSYQEEQLKAYRNEQRVMGYESPQQEQSVYYKGAGISEERFKEIQREEQAKKIIDQERNRLPVKEVKFEKNANIPFNPKTVETTKEKTKIEKLQEKAETKLYSGFEEKKKEYEEAGANFLIEKQKGKTKKYEEVMLGVGYAGLTFTGGVVKGFTSPIIHPVKTAKSMYMWTFGSFFNPEEYDVMVAETGKYIVERPFEFVGSLYGTKLLFKTVSKIKEPLSKIQFKLSEIEGNKNYKAYYPSNKEPKIFELKIGKKTSFTLYTGNPVKYMGDYEFSGLNNEIMAYSGRGSLILVKGAETNRNIPEYYTTEYVSKRVEEINAKKSDKQVSKEFRKNIIKEQGKPTSFSDLIDRKMAELPPQPKRSQYIDARWKDYRIAHKERTLKKQFIKSIVKKHAGDESLKLKNEKFFDIIDRKMASTEKSIPYEKEYTSKQMQNFRKEVVKREKPTSFSDLIDRKMAELPPQPKRSQYIDARWKDYRIAHKERTLKKQFIKSIVKKHAWDTRLKLDTKPRYERLKDMEILGIEAPWIYTETKQKQTPFAPEERLKEIERLNKEDKLRNKKEEPSKGTTKQPRPIQILIEPETKQEPSQKTRQEYFPAQKKEYKLGERKEISRGELGESFIGSKLKGGNLGESKFRIASKLFMFNRFKSSQENKSKFRVSQKSEQKQKQSQKQGQIQSQIQIQIQGQEQEQIQKQNQMQEQLQKQKQIQRQEQIQKQNQMIEQRPIEIIKLKEETKQKLFPQSITQMQGSKRERFKVSVRRKGVFKEIGEMPTFQAAFTKGAMAVKQTAAASFKVTGKQEGAILPREFYSSKKEKGVFIQRNVFRISSPGEKKEIPGKARMMNIFRRR